MSLIIYLYAFYTRSATYIQKARGSRLTFLIIYLMLCTRAAPRTKSKGLPIDISYDLSYAFYMRNTTYKKQEVLN
jgi:hypothetical protein